MIKILKNKIRQEIALLKKQYSRQELKAMSDVILSKIEETEVFQKATSIALYHAIPGEVQTASFIEKWHTSKQIFLPVVQGDVLELRPYTGSDSLKTGVFGILEPTASAHESVSDISLVIIPGVAFDRNRNRMGRGKGYYDKLLHQMQAYKIGICYDFQLIPEVPSEPFDISMDMIITESETIS